MKQIMLGESAIKFERKLKMEIICCVVSGIMVIGLNLLLCFLRTDENHSALKAINILSDIIYGCAMVYRVESSILIRERMLKMWKRPRRTYVAVVEKISQNRHRIPGIDCIEVFAGERRIYLPQTGTIQLEEGNTYAFGLVDNVIVEAETWVSS